MTEPSDIANAAGETTSEYSVVDPGMTSVSTSDDSADVLADLKAQNSGGGNGNANTSADTSKTGGDDNTVVSKATDDNADFYDDDLIDRALDAGLTAEDLREATSANHVRNMISLAERMRARSANGNNGGKTQPATTTQSEIKEPDWQQMLDDGHDPQIITVQKSVWQQALAARSAAEALQKAESDRAFARQCEQFDNELDGMNGYEAVLGKGRIDTLRTSNPQQAAARQKVYTQMEVLRAGLAAMNQPPLDEQQLIRAAVAATFPTHAASNARQTLKRDISTTARQAVPQPTGGARRPLTGAQAAADKEEQFWKSHSL